jgi:hypothetical protein
MNVNVNTRMTSSCTTRRVLAEELALTARLYAEAAGRLASSGKSGIAYARLREHTSKALRCSEAAFRAFTDHVVSHQCGEITQNGNRHLDAQPAAAQQ